LLSTLTLLVLALASPPADAPPRGFVASPSLALTFNPFVPIPSGDLSLFLGGALPLRMARPGHWVAVGYRLTGSLGFADLSTTNNHIYFFGHRHHLAFQGVTGEFSRFAYAADLGFSVFHAPVDDGEGQPLAPVAVAMELEVRVGRIVGGGVPGRPHGIVGMQVRLPGGVSPTISAPFPTFGLFFGINFGKHVPPAPPRKPPPPRPQPATPRDFDADGLADPQDRCPRDPGPAPHGCPQLDRDRDGSFAELPCPACTPK